MFFKTVDSDKVASILPNIETPIKDKGPALFQNVTENSQSCNSTCSSTCNWNCSQLSDDLKITI